MVNQALKGTHKNGEDGLLVLARVLLQNADSAANALKQTMQDANRIAKAEQPKTVALTGVEKDICYRDDHLRWKVWYVAGFSWEFGDKPVARTARHIVARLGGCAQADSVQLPAVDGRRTPLDYRKLFKGDRTLPVFNLLDRSREARH
jgi:hypothetical protein